MRPRAQLDYLPEPDIVHDASASALAEYADVPIAFAEELPNETQLLWRKALRGRI